MKNSKSFSPDDEEIVDCRTCCNKRLRYFCGCFSALGIILVGAGVVGFILSLYIYSTYAGAMSTRVYFTDGAIQSFPHAHIVAGAVPLAMKLPNDMSAFVGPAIYSIDCNAGVAHSVEILSGVQPMFWDGISKRTATCTAGAKGAGLSFVVVSRTQIRIIGSSGVTFI